MARARFVKGTKVADFTVCKARGARTVYNQLKNPMLRYQMNWFRDIEYVDVVKILQKAKKSGDTNKHVRAINIVVIIP